MDSDRFNRADVRQSCPHSPFNSFVMTQFHSFRVSLLREDRKLSWEIARPVSLHCSPRHHTPYFLQTLANWPPSVPGACKWWAHLQGSMLVVARDKPLPEEGSHSGKAMAASQAHAHDSEDALIVREIDLQGCRHAIFFAQSLLPHLHLQLCSLLRAGCDTQVILLQDQLRRVRANTRIPYGILARAA